MAIAIELAKLNANIVIAATTVTKTPRRSETIFEAKQYLEETYKVKVLAVKCDLRLESEIKELVSQTLSEFGSIDILVNNSGAMFPLSFESVE